MGRVKIDFGIDLGTTNSAIARIDNGSPMVIKSDTLKDTVPSCIHLNKKGVVVGDTAFNQLRRDYSKALKTESDVANTYIEFKRLMGTTEKYTSAHRTDSISPEELSAEVLKRLKSFVNDELLRSIVITVPAKFTINQKDATVQAGKFAGFDDCRLLQEPIAAAMAYGVDGKGKDGWWVVFDFGGGTFDAALLEVKDSIINVRDTEGDNLLGGKNLDYAIVDEFLIPYLEKQYSISSFVNDPVKRNRLRDALKFLAEMAKIQLSFSESAHMMSEPEEYPEDDNGVEIEIDATMTRDDLRPAVEPLYQKAIDITKQLLERNNLSGAQVASVIMVGGPTYSPIVREMIRQQITPNVDTSIDPMTAVARGAALYASTQDISSEIKEESRDLGKVQLDIDYEATTVEMTELVTIRVNRNKTTRPIPSPVYVEVVRGDKQWSSGRVELGEMGDVIDVQLESGRSNSFDVVLYDGKGDVVPSEPGSIAILQGTRIGSATLSYNVAIGVFDPAKGCAIVRTIEGLEKNKSQPATGIAKALRTSKMIRPGMKEDVIRIPIYEAEDGANGSRVINSLHVFDGVITGEAFDVLLPEGSEVELTLKLRDGENLLSAYFPAIDKTETLIFESNKREGVSPGWLSEEIDRLEGELEEVESNVESAGAVSTDGIRSELDDLRKQLEAGGENADTKMTVLESLRKLSQRVDDAAGVLEWPSKQSEMEEAFYEIKRLAELDDVKKSSSVDQRDLQKKLSDFERRIAEVVKRKDMRLADDLIKQLNRLDFQIRDSVLGVHMEILMINQLNDEFDSLAWKNRSSARQLIDNAIRMVNSGTATKGSLKPIVQELWRLLPDDTARKIGGGGGLLIG